MTGEVESQVRRVLLEPVAGLPLFVLVPADANAVLDAAIRDSTIDPYAHALWPAGLAAAAALAVRLRAMCSAASGRDALQRVTVLDVGAGCGIVSLTAAAVGATAVALDHDAGALRRVAGAAAMQALNVSTMSFDMMTDTPLPRADIAVFSDVLYQPDLARAAALRAIEARESGTHVIVADPGRAGRAVFAAMLTQRGYDVAFEPFNVRLPGDADVTIGVLQLTP